MFSSESEETYIREAIKPLQECFPFFFPLLSHLITDFYSLAIASYFVLLHPLFALSSFFLPLSSTLALS